MQTPKRKKKKNLQKAYIFHREQVPSHVKMKLNYVQKSCQEGKLKSFVKRCMRTVL